jgi:ribosomal protein S18 acetylase RimI-like enzyme
MTLRTQLRSELRPGDLGAIGEQHARIYASEFGLDIEFERDCLVSLAKRAVRGWPRARAMVRIVELRNGRLGGSVMVTDEGPSRCELRFLALEPELRGVGLGAELLTQAMAHARSSGYEHTTPETMTDLTSAARLFRQHGFEITSIVSGQRWGRPDLVTEFWELRL